MSFFALALSTGITPFLSYLRYMKHNRFGRSQTHGGADFFLVVSVRHQDHLMAHEELIALEGEFPDNFHYHPVLTRNWPKDWPYTTGRIIDAATHSEQDEKIDIGPLLSVVPDINQRHVRFCGNKLARDQLQYGLAQHSITPLSFRAEVW